jgi:hypothetical protein
LGAGPVAKHKEYYKGEGGDFPEVWVVVSFVSPCLPMACPYIEDKTLEKNWKKFFAIFDNLFD